MDKQNLPDWPDEYPEPIKPKKETINPFLIFASIALVGSVIICLISIVLWRQFVRTIYDTPLDININISSQVTPTQSLYAYSVATLVPLDTNTFDFNIPVDVDISIPSLVPLNTSDTVRTTTPTPKAYATVNVNEFETYTVYWQRELWENAIPTNFSVEDFEGDEDGYGVLSLPYLSPTGFFLEGQRPIQFLNKDSLLTSGNYIYFRDELKFSFPNENSSKAFGFDYDRWEEWQLRFNNSEVMIPDREKGFVGIVLHKDPVKEFVLSPSVSARGARGGLAIDNISYVPTETP